MYEFGRVGFRPYPVQRADVMDRTVYLRIIDSVADGHSLNLQDLIGRVATFDPYLPLKISRVENGIPHTPTPVLNVACINDVLYLATTFDRSAPSHGELRGEKAAVEESW